MIGDVQVTTFVALSKTGKVAVATVLGEIVDRENLVEPVVLAASALTKLWRARFQSPLPLAVGGYEVAAYVVFYSPDHPKMYADFDPALSPWLDYPADLKKGFVGACAPYARECIADLDALNPNAEKLTVSVTRQIGGVKGETAIYNVRISPPAN